MTDTMLPVLTPLRGIGSDQHGLGESEMIGIEEMISREEMISMMESEIIGADQTWPGGI